MSEKQPTAGCDAHSAAATFTMASHGARWGQSTTGRLHCCGQNRRLVVATWTRACQWIENPGQCQCTGFFWLNSGKNKATPVASRCRFQASNRPQGEEKGWQVCRPHSRIQRIREAWRVITCSSSASLSAFSPLSFSLCFASNVFSASAIKDVRNRCVEGKSRPSAVGAARTGVATNGTPASGQPTIPEVWTPPTLRNKRKDYNVLADEVSRHYPLRFSANWLHLKSGEPSRGQNCVSTDSFATTGPENRVEECLASGARQTIKQREIDCGGEISSKLTSRFKEFHSKIKEEWPRFENSWLSSERNTEQNRSLPTWVRQENWRFSEESKKTSIIGKGQIVWIERKFEENTVLITRQVLARRTAILHL